MKNLILLQIIIYLFISPIVLFLLGESTGYRFDLSIVCVVSFVMGSVFAMKERWSVFAENPPMVTTWLKIALIILNFAYVIVILSNGLTDRRQGSEVMAKIFANMPFYYLMIIRVYEVIFYPFVIIILFGFYRDKNLLSILLIVCFFLGFLFTGVAVSRAKLLMPLLFYYIFFINLKPNQQLMSRNKFLLLSAILGSLVFVVGLGRVGDFDGIFQFLSQDVLRRLDGLELISLVDEVVEIPPQGTWDINIFTNYVASIPFLDEAAALKELGLTSSKSYLLQVILGYTQYDMNNSMIADLYYFGGFILLIIGSFVFGYLASFCDVRIINGLIWNNRLQCAFMLSFVMNALRIEQDYFSMLLSIVRDGFILYLLFFGLKFFRSDSVSGRLSV